LSPYLDQLAGHHGAPSLNGTLYRDRNYFAQNGSMINGSVNTSNQSVYKNMNNLKNFDILNGHNSHVEHTSRNELLRGLGPQDDKNSNLMRQSKSDLKILRGENTLMSINQQMTKVKRANFNETFNPGPSMVMGTYNNYNVNKIAGGGNVEDVRQSLKLPNTRLPQNILVLDEGQNKGGNALPMISLRDSSNNLQVQKSALLKGATSQTNLTRNVNMMDSAETGYVGGTNNNNFEMSFKYSDQNRGMEKMRSIPNMDVKSKFPKEVFSLNIKKKYCA